MSDKYILDENDNPVLEPNLMKWAVWFEEADTSLKKDRVSDDISVSTVFLGLDHSFGQDPPLLFKTVVFGGGADQEQVRYSTWDEAAAGHKEMVERIKAKKGD